METKVTAQTHFPHAAKARVEAAERPAFNALLSRLRTPKEAAEFLRVSTSFLAKARMRGDGPPYIRVGRSIRYSETALLQWMKSRQRLSTSEH
jgi:Helix-turn-helix domain